MWVKVTGTWVNPNVTAMFLAMAMPALLILLQKAHRYQKIALAVLVMSIISIVLLKCRTAVIGGCVSAAIVLNYRYNLFQKLKNNYKGIKLAVIGTLGLTILLLAGIYLYSVKQASSNGRKLVWKVSLNMVAEKPLTGYGYGLFEHDYNLAQAAYFSEGKGTANEINNASFVRMAYSEFVENAVEGGLPALLIFTGLLLSLVIKVPSAEIDEAKGKRVKLTSNSKAFSTAIPKNITAIAAYAGIVCFAVMSIFNFTVQAIPVMCLFMVYAALLVNSPARKANTSFFKKISFPVWLQKFHFSDWAKCACACIIMLIAGYMCIYGFWVANAFLQNKNALAMTKYGNRMEAISILQPMQNRLSNSEIYWRTYANVSKMNNQYADALNKYNKALTLTSDPDLYLSIGNCNYKLKQYDEAKKAYLMAGNIQPNRLKPRYALMKLYQYISDTINVLKTANEILAMQPKGISKEALFYKKEAAEVVGQMKGQLVIVNKPLSQ